MCPSLLIFLALALGFQYTAQEIARYRGERVAAISTQMRVLNRLWTGFMADRMLRFVDIERRMPGKSDPDARRSDWHEIYRKFDADKAGEQASRCSQCGIPFCQVHCPLHNNIPDWLMLAAADRLEEAYEVSSATNSFPEICGRICPHDRLCESNCVIERAGHGRTTFQRPCRGSVRSTPNSTENSRELGLVCR